MKEAPSIREAFASKRLVFSFEVFPPKKDQPLEGLLEVARRLKELNPDFVSVTYGAGGSTRDRTMEIAKHLWQELEITPLAHLTCIAHTRDEVDSILDELDVSGIRNVLALRGDRPQDGQIREDFRHAVDLVRHIRARFGRGFFVAAAAYPEGHVESPSLKEDLFHLKAKVEAGVDLLITQLFFDNEVFFAFMEKLELMGVSVPVSAGIMPVLNASQISRIVSLCGASIPSKLSRIMARYEHDPESLKQAGIIYATEQILDLISWGVRGIHLYTMNRFEPAARIAENLRGLLEG